MRSMILCLMLVGCGGDSFSGFSGTVTFDADGDAAANEDAGHTTDGAIESDGALAAGGTGSGGTEAGGAASGGATTGAGGTVEAGAGGTRETGGALGSGGAPVCSLVTHDNGLGQTWRDCVALGTYDQAQAMRACKASGAAKCIDADGCGAGNLIVTGYDAHATQCVGSWGYGGLISGFVRTAADCSSCPIDGAWN